MPSKRKFYKTTFTVEVLSEEPIPDDLELGDLFDAPDYSVDFSQKTEEIDAPTAAKALEAQRSDPAFFGLTPDGEDDEDY